MDTLAELSAHLWELRESFDLLVYRCEVQELVLAAGRADSLPRAVAEVESALTAVQAQNPQVAKVLQEAAWELGIDDDGPGLRDVLDGVPDEWRTPIGDHLAALETMQDRITRSVAVSAEIAARGVALTNDILAGSTSVEPTVNEGYSDKGRSTSFDVSRPRNIKVV